MSRTRKFVISFVMVVVCLVAIEIASMLIMARYAPDEGPVQRRLLSGDERWLDLVLVGSLRWNLRDNPLTAPDAHVLFRVRPNLPPAEAMGMQQINEYGFRGPSPDAPGAGKRILVLGDSCAFGAGIRAYEDTFAHRLDAALDEWSVINLGQPGHSLDQQYVLFRDWEPKLAPDVVVIYSGWNDAAQAMVSDEWVLRAVAVERTAPVRLLHRSHFFQLVQGIALTARRIAGFHRVPPQRAVNILKDIHDRMAARGGRVIWVDPIFSSERIEASYGPGQDRGLPVWWSEVKPLLEAEHMRSFAILEREQILRGRNETEAMQADGFHPNEVGATYIASALAQLLEPQ